MLFHYRLFIVFQLFITILNGFKHVPRFISLNDNVKSHRLYAATASDTTSAVTTLLNWFTGTYNNKGQADKSLAKGKPTGKEGGHELVYALIGSHPEDENTLIASYHRDSEKNPPFRLRCYKLSDSSSSDYDVTMKVYQPKQQLQNKLKSGFDPNEHAPSLSEFDEMVGAEVGWKKANAYGSAAHFKGQLIRGEAQVRSDVDPNIMVTVKDEMTVWRDEYHYSDRAFGPDGRTISGNIFNHPYQMSKLKDQRHHAEIIKDWLIGSYSNKDQAKKALSQGRPTGKDGGHELIFTRIESHPLHSSVIVASFHRDKESNPPFRLRYYRLIEGDGDSDAIMRMYQPREQLLRELIASRYDMSNGFPLITEFEEVVGADILWRNVPAYGTAEHYVGGVAGGECKVRSDENPKEMVTIKDTMQLWRNELWINDRVFGPSGRLVSGNIFNQPYKYTKLSEFEPVEVPKSVSSAPKSEDRPRSFGRRGTPERVPTPAPVRAPAPVARKFVEPEPEPKQKSLSSYLSDELSRSGAELKDELIGDYSGDDVTAQIQSHPKHNNVLIASYHREGGNNPFRLVYYKIFGSSHPDYDPVIKMYKPTQQLQRTLEDQGFDSRHPPSIDQFEEIHGEIIGWKKSSNGFSGELFADNRKTEVMTVERGGRLSVGNIFDRTFKLSKVTGGDRGHVDKIEDWLCGSFNNAAQAAKSKPTGKEGGHELVYSSIKPHPLHHNILVASFHQDSIDNPPFRMRCYRFLERSDPDYAATMVMYQPKMELQKKLKSGFDTNRGIPLMSEFEEARGADVGWQHVPAYGTAEHYLGEIISGSCTIRSELDPSMTATIKDKFQLFRDELSINDRVFGPDGRTISGNIYNKPFVYNKE